MVEIFVFVPTFSFYNLFFVWTFKTEAHPLVINIKDSHWLTNDEKSFR